MRLNENDYAALAVNAIHEFGAAVDFGNPNLSRLIELLKDELCNDPKYPDTEWNTFINAAIAFAEASDSRNEIDPKRSGLKLAK